MKMLELEQAQNYFQLAMEIEILTYYVKTISLVFLHFTTCFGAPRYGRTGTGPVIINEQWNYS